MSVTNPVALALSWLLFCGCAEDAACLRLGGGYAGEDIEALEAECRADPEGYDCESDAFLERDEIACLTSGEWSTEVDEGTERTLWFSSYRDTVGWTLLSNGCWNSYSATTAELMFGGCV